MIKELESKWITGFWRRVGGLVIDGLLVGLVGLVLGLFFEEFFVQIGAWGRLFGFSMALIYFGVMNSSIAGGQTIGKKALKIRVVDSSNSLISLEKSVLRYVILALPFFLNGAHFSNEVMFSFLKYPISLIIFGGLFSIFYLYVFNRKTRQSLHDLVVGTYVVNINSEQLKPGKVWGLHSIMVSVLFLVAGIAPFFTTQLAESEPFKGMMAAHSSLLEDPEVDRAGIFSGSSTFMSSEGTRTATYVSGQVYLKANDIRDSELARRLATLIITNYPEARQKDAVHIVLTYGFDIGIASKWSNFSYNFNPRDL
ncbi:RDD family protein [Porticoccaceae bacterium LTM1]|nr:RDD family protein [Porticoccaceae bacterium LTM1]